MNECCVWVFYILFFWLICKWKVLILSLIYVNVSLLFGCKGYSIYIGVKLVSKV